jgi:hypothetical protein
MRRLRRSVTRYEHELHAHLVDWLAIGAQQGRSGWWRWLHLAMPGVLAGAQAKTCEDTKPQAALPSSVRYVERGDDRGDFAQAHGRPFTAAELTNATTAACPNYVEMVPNV